MTLGRDRKARIAAILLLVALTFLLSACAKNAPQDFLHPEGPNAAKADRLWNIVFPIAAAIFFIVEGLLIFAVLKFRHREGRQAAQFHGNTKVEVLLTAIPALILAGIAVPTVSTIFDLAEEPANALEVKVVAHQFWWEYQYPDLGIVTANELHIPTGQPIRIALEGAVTDKVDGSAEVIHSFWVPRLGGTQDIIPGRTNLLTLQADHPGTYLGQCKELCGIGHGFMRLRVIAQSPGEFDQWTQDLQAESTSAETEGQQLFLEGAEGGGFANGPACSSCHVADATAVEQSSGLAGPNLGGFANRTTFAGAVFENNTDNLVRWLEDPGAAKPGAKMPDLGLTQEQIDALVAYLQSLK
jgi:cytochrome c oxidase subunit II